MVALEEIVARLEGRLGALGDGPHPLEGGITNHNFRARFGADDVVLRVAGEDTELLGIDRGAERVANEAAWSLGLAPEVLAYVPEHSCLVTRWVPGTVLEAEQVREPARVTQLAVGLRAFHDRAPWLPVDFDVPRIAGDYLTLVRGRGRAVPAGVREAIGVAERVIAVLDGPEHAPVPCHDDLLTANIIADGERLSIVDWEYAGMGDRYFDLGNLSVNNGFDEDDDARLLQAYWGEAPTQRRLAALRLMRAVSDVRETLWGVVQGALSGLDFDFDGYAAEHLDRMHRAVADPRFERWLVDATAA